MKKTQWFLQLRLVGIGIVVGILLTVGTYFIFNRDTTIYTTRETIHTENGIVIPKGVTLFEHHELPEGVTTVRLYLNIGSIKNFDKTIDPRSFYVKPYWTD